MKFKFNWIFVSSGNPTENSLQAHLEVCTLSGGGLGTRSESGSNLTPEQTVLAIPAGPLGCRNSEKAAPSSLTSHSPSHNHSEDSASRALSRKGYWQGRAVPSLTLNKKRGRARLRAWACLLSEAGCGNRHSQGHRRSLPLRLPSKILLLTARCASLGGRHGLNSGFPLPTCDCSLSEAGSLLPAIPKSALLSWGCGAQQILE